MAERFVVTLNTATSVTIKSIVDIFLQVLQNFQNITVFKIIIKNTFCQWVNQNTCLVKLDNIFFWKLHVFEINISYLLQFHAIFRKELEEASWKSLIRVTYSWTWTWTWKISDCLTMLRLTLWYTYWTWTQKVLDLAYWTGIDFWYIGVRLEK